MRTWGRIIGEILTEKGLKPGELANLVGQDSRYIADLRAGRSKNPSSDFISKLVNKVEVNPDWLFSEDDSPTNSINRRPVSLRTKDEAGESRNQETDLLRPLANNQPSGPDPPMLPLVKDPGPGTFLIPMLDQALSAGHGAALPEADNVVAFIEAPRTLRRYGTHLSALTVQGDSMEPTLADGDLVVCDTLGWDGEGIYALRIDDSGLVKRLSKRPGGVLVISDNLRYPAYEVSEGQASIIGKVRVGIREM